MQKGTGCHEMHVMSSEKLSKYFPKSWTPAQMENQIFKLLESWHKRRQQMQER